MGHGDTMIVMARSISDNGVVGKGRGLGVVARQVVRGFSAWKEIEFGPVDVAVSSHELFPVFTDRADLSIEEYITSRITDLTDGK